MKASHDPAAGTTGPGMASIEPGAPNKPGERYASMQIGEKFLAAEDLPMEDVCEAGRRFFAFHDARDVAVAYGGLELAGGDILLRSVVTAPAQRGAGHGRAIVAEARSGARDLYLLTLTARNFFAKLGFEAIDRTAVPPAVAASKEFSSLCPSTAIAMKRRLRDA